MPPAFLFAGAAVMFGQVAFSPDPGDFTAAARFAAAVTGAEPMTPSPQLVIDTGATPQPTALDDYRRQRRDCQLSRLIRVQGDNEIGLEWRCGQINARLHDVYIISDGQVARVLTNVPFLVTARPRPMEPR